LKIKCVISRDKAVAMRFFREREIGEIA